MTDEVAPTRWRATLEYVGTGFSGWQVQPGARTVQGELEAALERLTGAPARVTASGRTDAGVHARGQVVSFDLPARWDGRAVREALNGVLARDVACLDARMAPPGFDARRWTEGKRYRYVWLDRKTRSPWWQDRVWHHPHALDEHAMAEAAVCLVGRHDFASFRAAGCASTHAVRTVESLTIGREGELLTLDVVGHGFLRHMVRNLAGTLTEVGRGRRPIAWVADVLAARDRTVAGPTAPAGGLCLMEVWYGDAPPTRAPQEDDE